ncbi:MAG: class II fructose-1,6-bisphosphate aldolase [Bacilli bacterium]|nr:class II fructose-1,6-bisphosphate aldolase [Bacilli bacterium]
MLVNFNEMLKKAKENHYAVPHLNINNLEWTKYILEECQELDVPVILGVSEGAAKYMGGFEAITGMVRGLIKDLNISIPVCLHVDHGQSFETCKKAIDAGFTSVMIDASKLELDENVRITKEVVDYAHERGVSVEAEVGHIGGTEDNITSSATNATVEECLTIYKETGIDALAPALGSVHGFYKGEPNLDFERMEIINKELSIPLVLHGGSGIPDDKIKKAIACGISKINVNTELQYAWSEAVRKFLQEDNKSYDPRKVIGSGEQALKDKVREKVVLFATKK